MDLPNILDMISRDNDLIKYISLYFLQQVIKECNNNIQGDLFFNKEFVSILIC